MIYIAFVLGVVAGCWLAYELIELLKKIINKHSGDEHVE